MRSPMFFHVVRLLLIAIFLCLSSNQAHAQFRTPEVPFNDISLTVESEGLRLSFSRIDFWEVLPRNSQPENDLFMAILGKFENQTADLECIYQRDFSLSIGDETYKFSGPIRRASSFYDVTYPGSFLGHCVSGGESEETLLLFDVTKSWGAVELTFDDSTANLDADFQSLLSDSTNPIPTATATAIHTSTPKPLPTATDTATANPTATSIRTSASTSLNNSAISESRQPLTVLDLRASGDTDRQEATVTRIIDGDTIEVEIDGEVFPVRYIGIDSPEFDQPLGTEASDSNRQLVGEQTVYLESDISDTDPYDRLLRYVYLSDGTFVNQELIRQGFAKAVAYPPDTKHQALFEQAQNQASESGVGLWAQVETGPTVNSGSNLRAGPGTNYAVVGQATIGQAVVISGQTAAGDWYQLDDDSWIAGFLVDNAAAEIEVVAAPPPPAPPTAAPISAPLPTAIPAVAESVIPAEPVAPAEALAEAPVEAPVEAPAEASSGTPQVVILNVFYDGLVSRVESDEYAVIANVGSAPANLAGWRLNAGDDGQNFYFPAVELAPGANVRVYTNEIHPESGGFSFGKGQAIWNNKGDCGELYDEGERLVSEKCY